MASERNVRSVAVVGYRVLVHYPENISSRTLY
jgi:hypothetical protein